MRITKILFVFALLLVNIRFNGQMRQSTPILIACVCGGEMCLWDNERGIVNYNERTNNLELNTDIFEITAEGMTPDSVLFETEDDGLTFLMHTHLSIPDLDFKSSADNGQEFTFMSEIKCNGIDKKIPVRYKYFYAPRVAESNLNGAPLCNFRLDFMLSFAPSDFNLKVKNGCNEIVIKVQDALLNCMN